MKVGCCSEVFQNMIVLGAELAAASALWIMAATSKDSSLHCTYKVTFIEASKPSCRKLAAYGLIASKRPCSATTSCWWTESMAAACVRSLGSWTYHLTGPRTFVQNLPCVKFCYEFWHSWALAYVWCLGPQLHPKQWSWTNCCTYGLAALKEAFE